MTGHLFVPDKQKKMERWMDVTYITRQTFKKMFVTLLFCAFLMKLDEYSFWFRALPNVYLSQDNNPE